MIWGAIWSVVMAHVKMTRPAATTLIDAIIATLIDEIDVDLGGGEEVAVGDGEAPNCPPPFLIVSSITSPEAEGPLDDTQADVEERIQISAVGETRSQADFLRDKSRAVMTAENINEDMPVDRMVDRVVIDLDIGVTSENRGRPEPLFIARDQYKIRTTPA